MFFCQKLCQIYTPCRHQSLKYCNSNIHFLWLGLTFFQNIHLQHTFSVVHTSRIITTATTVVQFCFQGQLWWGFTSIKFFLSVGSSEALIQRCSLMKYGTSIARFSFKIDVLNTFGKILENISKRVHIQHNYEFWVCALSYIIF